ncbi:hypothetical protein A6A27_31875 [Micromonospora sp. CB01531]|nr:hypothetical protein A6A27_31875 [Micromonospora sp. CB01531]
MPYDPPVISGDLETYRVSLSLGNSTIILEPQITPGPFPEDPTPPEVFQDLVNFLILKYELYAERRAASVARCIPDEESPVEPS